MRAFALIFLASLAVNAANADNSTKVTVSLKHTGDDSVGRRLAFAVREEIRASKGYELVTSEGALMRISLITLDPEKNDEGEGHSSVASAVITLRNLNAFEDSKPWTWYPIYLTSYAMVTGSNRVEESAKDILSLLDEEFETLKKDSASSK